MNMSGGPCLAIILQDQYTDVMLKELTYEQIKSSKVM